MKLIGFPWGVYEIVRGVVVPAGGRGFSADLLAAIEWENGLQHVSGLPDDDSHSTSLFYLHTSRFCGRVDVWAEARERGLWFVFLGTGPYEDVSPWFPWLGARPLFSLFGWWVCSWSCPVTGDHRHRGLFLLRQAVGSDASRVPVTL